MHASSVSSGDELVSVVSSLGLSLGVTCAGIHIAKRPCTWWYELGSYKQCGVCHWLRLYPPWIIDSRDDS